MTGIFGGRPGRTAALLLALLLLAACGGGSDRPKGDGRGPGPASDAPAREDFVPYDVRPLLKPSRKYLGTSIDGVPRSMAPVRSFAARIGKRPNLIEFYSAWGDRYERDHVRAVWDSGALPLIAWEPFETPIADIAAGRSDAYIRAYAEQVRALNLPVAISFGHEMNGHWYPWGSLRTEPADFVRAWRRIHDLFQQEGATTVIWVWSPNVINPMPHVALKPFYPGDAHVDWIGLIGYYTRTGEHTFRTLYGPTVKQVRRFTRKPFLIQETGSQPGPRKRRDVADLLAGVAAARSFIGVVWFNHRKRADWRIESDPAAQAEFRRRAAHPVFGFDVRRP
ncbi:glycoside hydrolase family 26 protein [Spirillospora sp. CA-253888]